MTRVAHAAPWALIACLGPACPGTTILVDGGDARPDGGPALQDGGTGSDAGAGRDAGGLDDGGARPDAGPPGTDGGPGADAGPLCPATVTDPSLQVALDIGVVEGTPDDDRVRFLGIPYAAPPTGARRLRPPAPPACLDDVLVADDFGPRCPQPGALGFEDEDCLYLNVWTPALDDAARPVLFFVHGGANVAGAANDQATLGVDLYDGSALAAEQDVVVVTINYRLGPLGFFRHPDTDGTWGSNYALLDQIQALRWVQKHIEAFGGDKDRVMLFGESAGGENTCALLAAPGAAGLFSRAIVQSGTCYAHPADDGTQSSAAVVEALGCDQAPDVLACLQDADVVDFVINAQFSEDVSVGWTASYGPIVDGLSLPLPPLEQIASGAHNQVPTIVGTNAHETELFTPAVINTCFDYAFQLGLSYGEDADLVLAEYPCLDYLFARWAFVDATTDQVFTCPARRALQALSTGQAAPVYRYYYDYTRQDPNVTLLRAFHAGELAILFDTYGRLGYFPPSAEDELSDRMGALWASFAADGVPDADGLPAWPPYDVSAHDAYVLDTTIAHQDDVADGHCVFWDGLGL